MKGLSPIRKYKNKCKKKMEARYYRLCTMCEKRVNPTDDFCSDECRKKYKSNL